MSESGQARKSLTVRTKSVLHPATDVDPIQSVRQVHVGFWGWNTSSTDCFGALIRDRSLRSFICASSFCRKRKRGDRVACPDRPCFVIPKPFWPLCVI